MVNCNIKCVEFWRFSEDVSKQYETHRKSQRQRDSVTHPQFSDSIASRSDPPSPACDTRKIRCNTNSKRPLAFPTATSPYLFRLAASSYVSGRVRPCVSGRNILPTHAATANDPMIKYGKSDRPSSPAKPTGQSRKFEPTHTARGS